jgi:hypothetical protein
MSGQRRKKTPKKTLTQTQIRRRGKKKRKRGSSWSRDCKDLEHKYFIYGSLEQGPGGTETETRKKQRVCHTLALPFTLKRSILRQKKNYGNSNISPCQNIIFKNVL